MAARKVIVEGDWTAWLYVCERNGCAALLWGGEAGGAVIRRSWDIEEIGGLLGDLARSPLLRRDGGRRAGDDERDPAFAEATTTASSRPGPLRRALAGVVTMCSYKPRTP